MVCLYSKENGASEFFPKYVVGWGIGQKYKLGEWEAQNSEGPESTTIPIVGIKRP